MRLALMSLLMIPLTVGCDGGGDTGSCKQDHFRALDNSCQACEQYAEYICGCSDTTVAAACDAIESYAAEAIGDDDAQEECGVLLEELEDSGICVSRAKNGHPVR